MYGDAPSLNGQYTVVGEVVDGMEAVDASRRARRPTTAWSTDPDKIISMKVAADAQ